MNTKDSIISSVRISLYKSASFSNSVVAIIKTATGNKYIICLIELSVIKNVKSSNNILNKSFLCLISI